MLQSMNQEQVSDFIAGLKESGKLKKLVKLGIIPLGIVTKFEMHERIKHQKANTRKKLGRVEIISIVAEEFRVDQSTVYRAQQLMVNII